MEGHVVVYMNLFKTQADLNNEKVNMRTKSTNQVTRYVSTQTT